ncbi:MAG: hypothetical protein IPJ65_18680 [Archangiaceae bacterium]|nr:hypothetical protein [Archangiaceae bacterium]
MLEFFIAGGPPMVFLLVLGLLAVVSAARFMRSPDARRVATVVALSVATFFAAVTGVVADLSVFTHRVAQNEDWLEHQLAAVVLQGFSESLSPAILGGTLLCVTWMLMAVGYRRLSARLPPA